MAGLGGIVAVGCWLRAVRACPRTVAAPPRGWALVRPGLADQAGGMAATVTVNEVLDGHVGLDVECLDRIYLNGYVPNLQWAGRWCRL